MTSSAFPQFCDLLLRRTRACILHAYSRRDLLSFFPPQSQFHGSLSRSFFRSQFALLMHRSVLNSRIINIPSFLFFSTHSHTHSRWTPDLNKGREPKCTLGKRMWGLRVPYLDPTWERGEETPSFAYSPYAGFPSKSVYIDFEGVILFYIWDTRGLSDSRSWGTFPCLALILYCRLKSRMPWPVFKLQM